MTEDATKMLKKVIEANKKMINAHNNLVKDLETFKAETNTILENLKAEISALKEQ